MSFVLVGKNPEYAIATQKKGEKKAGEINSGEI
jgi:hypothetical protein